MESNHRAGVVAVVGRPNVGKSTLVNSLVEHKVSIVSSKPQTTRRRALGIATRPEAQVVFVDTPGLHQAHNRLGRALNESARQSLDSIDMILVVVDGSRPPNKEDESVAQMLDSGNCFPPKGKAPIVLCLNKMDKLKPENVERHFDLYGKLFRTDQIILTSFLKKQNTDVLWNVIVSHLPEGDNLYPEDEFTDQSMRALAAEIIREKALLLTRAEVPHALATTVEEWEEHEGRTHIAAVILVERDGQKAIVIGRKGSMLKQIGTEARLEIEELIGGPVYLEIFVKVRDEWRSNPRILRELEYL